jgi:nitronate monooxygenase
MSITMRLTEQLGIRHPIVSAPIDAIAGLHAAALAAGGDDGGGPERARHRAPWALARYTGWVLWNDLLRERLGREGELRAVGDAQAARYCEATRAGDGKLAATIVGEAVGLVHAVEPAADISERRVAGAKAMLKHGAALVP